MSNTSCIKKNDPVLRFLLGRGLFGRVMPVRFRDGKYAVFQHVPGTPKDRMEVTFQTCDLGDGDLLLARQLFFHRYGTELVKVKLVRNFVPVELELAPVSAQKKIEHESFTRVAATAVQDRKGDDPAGARREGRADEPAGPPHRKRGPLPEAGEREAAVQCVIPFPS